MFTISFRKLIFTISGAYLIGTLFTACAMWLYFDLRTKNEQENLTRITAFAETLRESAVFYDQRAVVISAKAMYALEQKDYKGLEKELDDLLQFHVKSLRSHADRPEILDYLSTLQEASIQSPGLKRAMMMIREEDKKK